MGHEMSSLESEAMAGIPIVTDTIDDLDEAWECSDYSNGNDSDQDGTPSRFNAPIPRKSNHRQPARNMKYGDVSAPFEHKSEEVVYLARNTQSPPSPPRVAYKRGNSFGTLDKYKFPDTKSSAHHQSARNVKKPRPNTNRPTKPPLKMKKAARHSNQMRASGSKRSAPELMDRTSVIEADSRLQDRASTTMDGDVATLNLSQSRTSCKAPDNEHVQQRPQRKNKSKRRRHQRQWQKKQNHPPQNSTFGVGAQHFDPSVSPNPVMYGQYSGSQSMPNSAYVLPFVSSVPMQGTEPTALLGSVPMVTAPSLNRAMTAPGMGQTQNMQQLTATVAQLQSHFCAILQHLPLTTSQQNQLLSAPNSVSMPNAPDMINDVPQNIDGPTSYQLSNAQPMLPMGGAQMFAVTNQPLMAQPPPMQYRHSDPNQNRLNQNPMQRQ